MIYLDHATLVIEGDESKKSKLGCGTSEAPSLDIFGALGGD